MADAGLGAIKIASGETKALEVTPELVREYLGKPRFQFEAGRQTLIPGPLPPPAIAHAPGPYQSRKVGGVPYVGDY